MSEGTWIALIAALSAVAMSFITQWNLRRAKEQEYDRQDEITAKHGAKLDVIHGLVNGNITISMQNELAALKALHQLQLLNSSEAHVTETRIADLESQIAYRVKLHAPEGQ